MDYVVGVHVDVSVVIPTHDRPASLMRLLDALRRQSIGTQRFEAIVVDDGSRVPVAAESGDLRMRVLRHPRPRGPAAARNTGWRAASAQTVAFIDDDCAPSEGWLEAVLDAAGEQIVVQGRVEPMPDQLEHRRPLSHTIEVGGLSLLFVSANVTYPRSLLERVGGFDERFTRACGEDAELGARVTRAGAIARFASDALVYHEVRELGLAGHIRHTLKWTDAVEALAMHPELRSLLTLRIFWKPTHLWLLGGLAAVLARRPYLGGFVVTGYLMHYRRLYGNDLPGLSRALPTHLVIDATEIATAIVGSLRHRTLML